MSVETGTDSGVKIISRQSPPEVHEGVSGVSELFQHTNEWVLMDVLVENNPHLNMTPLFIHHFTCLTSALYDMQVGNMAERNFSENIPGKLVAKQENNIYSGSWQPKKSGIEGCQKQHIWKEVTLVNSIGVES